MTLKKNNIRRKQVGSLPHCNRTDYNMDNILIKEIENHLATFPERHRYVEEMREEWQNFKSKALWVLIGLSASLIAIGVWVGTMQTHIESVTNHEDEDKARFTQLEQKVNASEVSTASILARLSSIDTALQEIKVAIKQIK